ncbi:MAG: tetratricopeptide repeat protein [Planctomycetia bacterium]|nr:tetratricopeptide repeat protein [Planctomycetia bacterium]
MKTDQRQLVCVCLSLLLLFLGTWGLCGRAAASEESDRYQRGYLLWQQQNWNQAIATLESFIAAYPNSTMRNDAELYLGHSYLSRNNFINDQDGQIGRSHLDFIIQQGKTAKDYRDACLHYAYSLYSLSRYAEAKPRLEQYIAEFPDDDTLQYALYYLGVCESRTGNYAKAEEYFNRCISKYPSGSLKAECQLDRALAIGRQGRYSEADRDLSMLAMDRDYKYAPKAALQRASLKMEQRSYTEALALLQSFIASYANVQGAQSYVSEAYQYMAWCHMEMKNYDLALAAAQELEKMSGMTPDSALLKIRILTKMNRFDEANAAMQQLRNSQFALYAPDVLTYYQGTILLAQGRWDEAINTLLPLLAVQANPQSPSQVTLNYYNSNTSSVANKLQPGDFLEAAGTLVLSYASRYGATRQYTTDNTMQDAIFNDMFRYAKAQNDNQLFAIVSRIDQERADALVHPIGAGQTGSLVINTNPNTAATGSGATYPGTTPVTPGSTGTIPPYSGPSRPGAPASSGNLGNITPAGTGQGTAGNLAPVATQPQSGGSNTNQPVSTWPTGRVSEADASSALTQAGALCISHDYDKADQKLLQLLSSSDTFFQDCPTIAPAAALLRANILFKLRKSADARSMCNLLISQAPNSKEAVNAYYYLGYCHDFYAQQNDAIACFEKVINSSFDSDFTDDAYYYLGLNEWERKNTDYAQTCFRKIYRSYKDSDYWSHATWALAQIEFDSRNYEAAEDYINEVLEEGPDQSVVDWCLFLKGEIALRLQDYEKARIAFNTIVTQYPESEKAPGARARLENMPAPANAAPKKDV